MGYFSSKEDEVGAKFLQLFIRRYRINNNRPERV